MTARRSAPTLARAIEKWQAAPPEGISSVLLTLDSMCEGADSEELPAYEAAAARLLREAARGQKR